jgi:hypothetical protein
LKLASGKLTYSNVISTLCLFLLLGGGTAFAANQLGKNSVGSKQIKKNAVTTAKLKNGAVTGSKIKLSTLGTVPSATKAGHATTADNATNAGHATTADNATNAGHATTADNATNAGHATTADNATNAGNSATTSVVKGAKGTLSIGQESTIFQYGPFTITAQCQEYTAGYIGERFLISSSSSGSAFASWDDGSSTLGPATPEEERELSSFSWSDSNGPYEYEGPADVNVSASAPSGQAFNAFIGEATEKNSNTCWYWLTANVIS